MDHTVDGRHSGHGIFEDALPFTENQIGGNHDGFALIAFSQEGEEDFHFITGVLNITNIIQDHAGKLLELGQLLRKAQISLGGEQTLHQCAGWCPEDRIPCVDELIPYGPRIAQRGCCRAKSDLRSERCSKADAPPARDSRNRRTERKKGGREQEWRTRQEKRRRGSTRRSKLLREEGTDQLSRRA